MINKETLAGQWNELKGKVKEEWGKLTDDDITEINGKKDQLMGKLQKKYGFAKEKAEESIKNFEKKCESCNASNKSSEHASASHKDSKFHSKH